VKSHSCGTGEVPLEIVKLMLLLKIQSLSYGYSGVQTQTVERRFIIIFYRLYTQGSLGASGDLAPLAHCLCLYLRRRSLF
jgi:histidine ammonia-lyase